MNQSKVNQNKVKQLRRDLELYLNPRKFVAKKQQALVKFLKPLHPKILEVLEASGALTRLREQTKVQDKEFWVTRFDVTDNPRVDLLNTPEAYINNELIVILNLIKTIQVDNHRFNFYLTLEQELIQSDKQILIDIGVATPDTDESEPTYTVKCEI
jgi:hypothetical protein